MKMYAMFTEYKNEFCTKAMEFTGKKYIDTALGTDAFRYIDGRKSLRTAIAELNEALIKAKRFNPSYIGFNIYQGELLVRDIGETHRTLYRSIQ